jgi:hypothetical protein
MATRSTADHDDALLDMLLIGDTDARIGDSPGESEKDFYPSQTPRIDGHLRPGGPAATDAQDPDSKVVPREAPRGQDRVSSPNNA